MKQDTFLELISQKLIKQVIAQEAIPSKGKSLKCDNTGKILNITLYNNTEAILLSSRGTQRDWASLNTLKLWLKNLGISEYQIKHMEVLHK